MIKYRVINKEVIGEDMSIDEALMAIDVLRTNNPGVTYDIEDYVWSPCKKGFGRDPDLH